MREGEAARRVQTNLEHGRALRERDKMEWGWL